MSSMCAWSDKKQSACELAQRRRRSARIGARSPVCARSRSRIGRSRDVTLRDPFELLLENNGVVVLGVVGREDERHRVVESTRGELAKAFGGRPDLELLSIALLEFGPTL